MRRSPTVEGPRNLNISTDFKVGGKRHRRLNGNKKKRSKIKYLAYKFLCSYQCSYAVLLYEVVLRVRLSKTEINVNAGFNKSYTCDSNKKSAASVFISVQKK